jgi:UDP-glucose 4-epimerase
MVSPRFVQQALSGQPITIYGDGTQSRCFGYVGDVVRGISRLSQEQAAVDAIFNLGSDEAISINGLAEMVRTITGQLLVDYPHTLRTGLRSRIRGH